MVLLFQKYIQRILIHREKTLITIFDNGSVNVGVYQCGFYG